MSSLTIDELRQRVGQEIGVSEPFEITQDRVNLFADATEDHQWIHVDPERARSGPFGGPIAHGYLTLSLIPYLLGRTFQVEGVRMGVNYGLNRVRFPNPVHVGKRIRARSKLLSAEEVQPNVIQQVNEITVEIEGETKPAMVAESVTRMYLASD